MGAQGEGWARVGIRLSQENKLNSPFLYMEGPFYPYMGLFFMRGPYCSPLGGEEDFCSCPSPKIKIFHKFMAGAHHTISTVTMKLFH